jgi:uncharacterized Zn finger protein
MYGGWGWRPYVPVAERRKKGQKAVARMLKNGGKVTPINISGRTIANTFWGKAWCEHLEAFSDYANRLPRGRSYVRNGSVIHLTIEAGKVIAFVQGSDLYEISIEIKSVEQKKWKSIIENCSGEIGSVIELMQGKLSSEVMKTITDQNEGLFPKPKEIELNCSCPDSAYMCKHVAAVMYGVGSRLDKEPELLFKLRKVDHLELISKATIKTTTKGISKSKALEGQDLSDLFSIDLEDDSNTTTLNVGKQNKKMVKTAKDNLKSRPKKVISKAKSVTSMPKKVISKPGRITTKPKKVISKPGRVTTKSKKVIS